MVRISRRSKASRVGNVHEAKEAAGWKRPVVEFVRCGEPDTEEANGLGDKVQLMGEGILRGERALRGFQRRSDQQERPQGSLRGWRPPGT